MRVTRRALLGIAGAIGLTGTARADQGDDDTDMSYGAMPYGEQGYGGSSTDCFIATAACGTSDHDDVLALRRFRDNVLLENRVGELMVQAYYATSPPVASWIAGGRRRRRTVRRLLIEPASRVAQLTEETHD